MNNTDYLGLSNLGLGGSQQLGRQEYWPNQNMLATREQMERHLSIERSYLIAEQNAHRPSPEAIERCKRLERRDKPIPRIELLAYSGVIKPAGVE